MASRPTLPVPSAPGPLTGPAVRALRDRPGQGLSRRQLIRRAVASGVGLWLVEVAAGTVAFLWSAVAAATKPVRVGTFAEWLARNGDLPIADGFPGYVREAKAFVVVVDPQRGGWTPGADDTGDGALVNVRVLSQRCPHLGCRPNPCIEDFWFRCPCHQSRYDRLGIKAAGELFGPAPRGLDRYPVVVDGDGVLTIDTSRIVLGPLPVAIGQPGLIPPLVDGGCV